MKSRPLDSHAPVSGVQRDSGAELHRANETEALVAILNHAAEMPLKNGAAALASNMLDLLKSLLPDHALGVCLVVAEGGDPWVDIRLPDTATPPRRDPTRLFPDFEHEHVVPLEGLYGSTLHMAGPTLDVSHDSIERKILVHAASILAAGCRAALALRAARPVSEEVDQLRAQLVQAEKLATLGHIVAGLVHELANPVTSIVACTDYLKKRATLDGERAEEVEQLKRIGGAADRILKFTRDLVAYARPASEAAGPVSLPEVVEQAYAFSQHELSRHAVQFVCHYDDGAPAVIGQTGPLTQVFINLFTNAAHAMENRGGMLDVRTRVDKARGRLFVDVTDSGGGIPQEILPKVFDPFFTTKEKGRGTGLGLSIVREILEAHGGNIDAVSTYGEGTTFTVALPLYSTD